MNRDFNIYEQFIFNRLRPFYEPEDCRILCKYIWVKDGVIYATNGKVAVTVEYKNYGATDYKPEDGFYRFDTFDTESLWHDEPASVSNDPFDERQDEVTEATVLESIATIRKAMKKYQAMQPLAVWKTFNPKLIADIMSLSEIMHRSHPAKISIIPNAIYVSFESAFLKVDAVLMGLRDDNA